MEPASNIGDDLLELHARVSALGLLLRITYANSWKDDQATFDELMSDLLRLTRDAPVASEPIAADTLQEAQARVATHLLRFQQQVHAIWHSERP